MAAPASAAARLSLRRAGLLALLLTRARREARTTAAGGPVPLDEQDRAKWDRGLIEEGIRLVKAALAARKRG